jgi:hypothetical protein
MAALPPNLNIPALTGANPAPSNPVEKNNNETNNQDTDLIDKKEKLIISSRRRIRNTFNISEMLLALPLLANSFVLQADNISEQVKNVENPGVFGTLSSVFKLLVDKFVAGGKTVDEIESNRSASLTQNFRKRILHPNITKEFTSLLFNTRRIVFNIFPNIFTVPSADHDPLHPDKNIASKSTATAYGIMASLTKPLTWISSVFAAITTVPSHLMGSYFTYTGNNEAYKATKYFNRISEIFTPLLSNLSSLLSVSKSYIDSYSIDGKTSLSKFVTQGRYNVGFPNMVQGILGSVTSMPYFFGILVKLRGVVQEKDMNNDYKFSKNLKILAENILPGLAPYIQKINQNFNVDSVLSNFKARIEKIMFDSDITISSFLDSVYNSNPFMKNLFSRIRPSDSIGSVQAVANNHTLEFNDGRDYTFGLIKKSAFFREIFDWLHPIQSMLMLLPNSLVEAQDPYIKDNSKTFGRRMDRLFGFNSMLLSFPNYLVYSATTRIPQLLLKACEYREREHILDKEKNNGYTEKVSGYQAYLNSIAWLKKLPIIGTDFLASKLESLNIDEETFIDESKFRSIFEDLDTSARKQESSVKASELVGAARIGFRTLLENESRNGSQLFFAERDKETGLTDDEKARKGFYDSVGKFKNIVGKIPVVGWLASPLIEAFRNIYKVDTTKRRNVVGTSPNQQQKIMDVIKEAQNV